MADKWAEGFAQLRRGPWTDDPNGIPQQRASSDGQAESTGWLSDNSVTADVIQANAVIASKIQAGAITTEKLAANAVTAAKIEAGTITSNEIAANTITAGNIAADAITASELAANSVAAENIIANTITASEIAANAITADEIAANAVTTAKLLAANVTSAKIELTVTGKNFGANDGDATNPGVFWDSDGDTGLYLGSIGNLNMTVAGGSVMSANSTDTLISNHLSPGGDNVYSLGSAILRWVDVWAVDGSINTSDKRLKRDITDVPLGLDFVRSLRPRAYRWRDTVDTQAREGTVLDEKVMAREQRPHRQAIRRIRARQQAGRLDDAEGNALVAEERQKIVAIRDRHYAPVREAQAKRRPGRRVHMGLIAQEVKDALDAAGVDMALWKETPAGEQALAYTELIAPMLRAIQELADEVESLKQQFDQ